MNFIECLIEFPGHGDMVHLLWIYGASVNAETIKKWTPLHFAAQSGQLKIAELLIEVWADVNATDINKLTPLHVAAENVASDIAELLIKKWVDVNAETINKWTPLHFAAQNGSVDVTEFLIEKGANISAESSSKWTPLHFATENGQTKVAMILISCGARVDAKNIDGKTPLDLAKNGNSFKISRYLPRINLFHNPFNDIIINVSVTRTTIQQHLDSLKVSTLEGFIPISITVGFSLIIVVVIILIYFLRERKRSHRFKKLLQGNPERIKLDRAMNDQACHLPYKKEFEFPTERLKLGKVLGAGEFGVVYEGFAYGILPREEETKSAVKKINGVSDKEVMKAFVLEAKIMMHLGQHLNVVNLLGVVTDNIAQNELMIIVEYCDYGNIKDLLWNNRERFINQINYENDTIDLARTNEHHLTDHESDDEQSSTDSSYSVEQNQNSESSESFFVCQNYPSRVESEHTKIESITTSDLLCWSFQVARGMHYLTSRNILHRDLAARNILLCTNNVVKICDFGLSRDFSKDGYYRKKQGEEKVPLKWLAPESLSEPKYSVHSDVWSFGIVLWEIFSLGAVPYPGVKADTFDDLKSYLQDENRMSKPEYATQSIYDIMISCWNTDPESRPLFDELEQTISYLMKSDDQEKCENLNKLFKDSIAEKYKSGENAQIDEKTQSYSCFPAIFFLKKLNKNDECRMDIPMQPINCSN
ncbi:vascular endothelial growth factor receptor 1-like [Contarinia nasturtii]|uniref:vascular endothelial growth factor receptor 1-like n=1 Tax=Contarinia nasturtii TaxID=265458 RepID=UPI0012D42BB0|nr:vascular endothelial growth factor receptor 1-like [Contarinia nasturtii]